MNKDDYEKAIQNDEAIRSGKRASEDDNLSIKYPDVASQWHPTKNKDMKPENFRPKSYKKIWWLCKRGHEWEAMISNRTRGEWLPVLLFIRS